MPTSAFETAMWFYQQGFPVFPATKGLTTIKGLRDRLKIAIEDPQKLLDEFKKDSGGKDPDAWCLFCTGSILAADAENDDTLNMLKTKYPNARIEKGSKGGHLFFRFTDTPLEKRLELKNEKGELALEFLTDWSCVLAGSKHRKKDLRYTVIQEGEIISTSRADFEEMVAEIKAGCRLSGEIKKEDEYLDVPRDKRCELIKQRVTFLTFGLKTGLQSCPLAGHKHHDANPSLSVRNDGQLANCFSKHGGMDIFSFIMERDNCDFVAARRRLAEIAGIPASDPSPAEPTLNNGTEQEAGEHIICRVPLQTVSVNDGQQRILKELFYTDHRIYTNKYKHIAATDEHPEMTITTFEPMMNGRLELLAIVHYSSAGDDKKDERLWHIRFEGKETVGTYEEVASFVFNHGTVVVRKDDLKSAFSAINNEIMGTLPRNYVYPAVGIYYDQEKKKGIAAFESTTVKPLTDMQKTFFERISKKLKDADMEKSKEVVQASIDFIEAMPKTNQYPTLIARGYSVAAVISYIFKATTIGVFPYLYLFGEKGSSKTHIAAVSAAYAFGDMELLTSDSVKSEFRLGLEISAGTLPRVIDEAHDVFVKNISIFKSAATSLVATKRGSKDKTMDSYTALSTFIFTSNVIPVSSESDVQGAMMDRVLVVNCERGTDFDKVKYQRAMNMLMRYNAVIGKRIIELLVEKLDNGGLDKVVDEVYQLTTIIQELDPDIAQRRAFCLAEVAWGIKAYLEVCAREGMLTVISPILYDDKQLCEMLITKLQADVKIDEKENLIKFMTFVNTLEGAPEVEMNRNGIFKAADYGDAELGDKTVKSVLISGNALDAYKRSGQFQQKPFSSLKEIERELKNIGMKNVEVTNNRKNGHGLGVWSIKVDLDEYDKQISEFFAEKNSEGGNVDCAV